jgi:hypothetical protein
MSVTKRRQLTASLAIVALLIATLACNTFTSANPLVATAQAVATQADELGDLAGTAQALATDVNLEDLAKTAEAVATEVNVADLAATAQAAATDANLGDLAATAQAAATSVAGGELPPNIPLPDVKTENLFTMEGIVSFSTPASFTEVLDFYKEAMLTEGWEFVANGSIETQGASILNYTRSDRDLIMTISEDTATKATFVQIIITNK